MQKQILVGVAVLSLTALSNAVPAQSTLSALPAQQHPGGVGLHKAGKMAKASSALARAFGEYRAHVAQGRAVPFRPSHPWLQYADGRILVDARATGNAAELLADLNALGMTRSARAGNLISGLLPLAAVEDAVALTNLRSIAASLPPITHQGSITSQADIALRAADARSQHGVDGNGITIGVISDSFDTLNGAGADIASGDLPPAGVPVIGGESTYCGSLIFCIDEGRAMAQLAYDLAPGADLLFHTALGGPAFFANGIYALQAAGADVIVDDIMYLNEPMFQDGEIAQAVDAVNAAGIAYYSAAGNSGRSSYEGDFDDSNIIFCIEFIQPIGDCNPIYERVGRMHDFDPGPGVDLYQHVKVPVGAVLTVAMQWDEPYGGPTGAQRDYDIVLLDEQGGLYFEISANDNVATGEGWEVLQFQNDPVLGYGEDFSIIITYDDVDSIGLPNNFMKTVVFGSSTIEEHATNSSTLMGHANAAGAQAVGAAFFAETPAYGVSPPQLEPFSSAGGTPILFSSAGAPLANAELRAKPEFTAVDGTNTTFFFNDSYGNDGIDDFFGTSAAAPHAAAVAALMLEANPNVSPEALKAALQSTAIDMEAPGFDHDSGYGLIQADLAIASLLADTGANAAPNASFSTNISDLSVDFTDTSTDSDGSVTQWSWNFGDGASSSQQHPTHVYAADGTYTVTLTVTDDDGDADQSSQPVTVSAPVANVPPTASFSTSISALSVDFTDTSTDSDGSVTQWSWNFGDGAVSSQQHPTHVYAADGTYTVTLTATDDDGDSDQSSQPVTVSAPAGNTPPLASYTYTCVGRDCNFDGTGSTDDGGIVSYTWDFGDGTGSSQPAPFHSYAANGNYTVTLTVTDQESASDSASTTLRVKNRGTREGSAVGGGGGGDTGGGGTIEAEKGRKKCRDGIDNDQDGLIDGDDPDC